MKKAKYFLTRERLLYVFGTVLGLHNIRYNNVLDFRELNKSFGKLKEDYIIYGMGGGGVGGGLVRGRNDIRF